MQDTLDSVIKKALQVSSELKIEGFHPTHFSSDGYIKALLDVKMYLNGEKRRKIRDEEDINELLKDSHYASLALGKIENIEWTSKPTPTHALEAEDYIGENFIGLRNIPSLDVAARGAVGLLVFKGELKAVATYGKDQRAGSIYYINFGGIYHDFIIPNTKSSMNRSFPHIIL